MARILKYNSKMSIFFGEQASETEDQLKYEYLMILYQVVDESTVCLMGHERRLTLQLIEDMAFQVYTPPPPSDYYKSENNSDAATTTTTSSSLSLLSPSGDSTTSSSSASTCSSMSVGGGSSLSSRYTNSYSMIPSPD